MAVPVVLAALLCAIDLNVRSFWIDEGATYAIVTQHGAALWHSIAHDGGNMLLYYLLIHVVVGLFGSAAWVMRMPSLLAQAATAGLVAALALRLSGERRQALTAGLLCAVSLPLVYWGQNARGYALMVALGTASMLAFTALVEPRTGGPWRASSVGPGRIWGSARSSRSSTPSAWTVSAYVLTTAAMLYVGYDAGLLILAQLVLLVRFRDRARYALGCLIAVAVLCMPLAMLALGRGSGQLFWVPALGGPVLSQAAQTLLSAGLPPSFHRSSTTIVAVVVTAVAVLAALAMTVSEARRPAGRRASYAPWLLVAWIVVPIVVALAVSALGEPIELARSSILLIPALALLLARALAHPALPSGVGAFASACVLALWLAQLVPSYGVSPENWRAATASVLDASPARSACVVFYPQDGREPFDYYVRRAVLGSAGTLTPVLPTLGWTSVKPFVERYQTLSTTSLAGIARRCPRLYLIASHVGQRSGPSLSRAHLRRYEQLERVLSARYGDHSEWSFGWAARVRVTLYVGAEAASGRSGT